MDLPVQTCWAADRWHMTHGGLCLKAGAHSHLGTWVSKWGGWWSERAAGIEPQGCTRALRDIPGARCMGAEGQDLYLG